MATILPRYGEASLADLLPAIASHLGYPSDDILALPNADRYVVVLVDGLGYELLAAHASRAPFLAGLGDRWITCGVPSTTATSLTSLGTGVAPGTHGMVGYSFRHHGTILNALSWDPAIDPVAFQPHETWFERLTARGVACTSVSIANFEGSGLTQAGLRGPEFVGLRDEANVEARVSSIVAASARGGRSLVYAYERRLDHVGHGEGCASSLWRTVLDGVDGWIGELAERLAEGTCLIVTGDHGMVDATNTIMIEDTPALAAGVDLVGGEGRLRQIYTRTPCEVARRWADELGERAIVRTRDEAIDEGWFGPVEPRVRSRIGDVLAAALDDWAIMTWTKPGELTLVGQHGSLTSAEMRVPLLTAVI